MLVKVLAGITAVALVLAYLTPMVVKMKDVALGIVVVIGIVTMFADLWQSLRGDE